MPKKSQAPKPSWSPSDIIRKPDVRKPGKVAPAPFSVTSVRFVDSQNPVDVMMVLAKEAGLVVAWRDIDRWRAWCEELVYPPNPYIDEHGV